MKVLILVEKAWLGGHTISAFTIAKELKDRGYSIVFVCDKGPLTGKIKNEFRYYEIPFYHYFGKQQTYFRFQSLKTVHRLIDIVRKEKIDLIHAFDPRSLIAGRIVSILHRIPVTATLCGGLSPFHNVPYLKRIMVFSGEQKQKLISKYHWNEDNVRVVMSRVNVGNFNNHSLQHNVNKFAGIPGGVKKIFYITRFDGTKQNAILYVMNGFRRLLEMTSDIALILLGGDDGEFYKKVREEADAINSLYNDKKIILTGPVIDAYKYLKDADIILGVGRSAFEGMGFRKPAMIIGENGFAGTVCAENIRDIEYYNFSGRNISQKTGEEKFVNEITRLLNDEKYYNDVSEYGFRYLIENIDIGRGIGKIIEIYDDVQAENKSRLFLIRNLFHVLMLILLSNYTGYFKDNMKTIFTGRKL